MAKEKAIIEVSEKGSPSGSVSFPRRPVETVLSRGHLDASGERKKKVLYNFLGEEMYHL
jgi:hypothetical protein